MIKKFFKWLWGIFKNTFILVGNILKSMWTFRGVIALLISFSIWVGWAIVFVIIGIIHKVPKLYITGTGVMTFYSGPFPMWVFITGTGWVVQKFILFDPEAMTWGEFKLLVKELFPNFYNWCSKMWSKYLARKERKKSVVKVRILFFRYSFSID